MYHFHYILTSAAWQTLDYLMTLLLSSISCSPESILFIIYTYQIAQVLPD